MIRRLTKFAPTRIVPKNVFFQSGSQTYFYRDHVRQSRLFSTPIASPSTVGASLGNFGDLAHTKIRREVKDENGKLLRISISQSAADKLNLIRKEDENPDVALRIIVESGGCHGFQYIFDLKNKSDITPEDGVFERNGACVVVDSTSLGVMQDATVDYKTELIGSQFKVTSPYTDSTCGCGTSFSFDPTKITS